MRNYQLLYIISIVVACLCSCSNNEATYRIGVSQCAGGKWRDKVNNEMLTAQHLYGNSVKVEIIDANNNSQRQARQIDSMAQADYDLLIVSPNDYTSSVAAIERARKRGIPVVLFDRKVDTENYTAYIGGDNVEAGNAMGHYALALSRDTVTDHPVRILEITGGTASSPAIDRHKGFAQAMARGINIEYHSIPSDWTAENVHDVMANYLRHNPAPDIVFCHSDLATMSARKAVAEAGKLRGMRFLGIDGLVGPGEGVDDVEKGLLAGTYIYPTHGEEIIHLAINILQGKPYKRNNIMSSLIVTPDNAHIVQQSGLEMQRQLGDLLTVQDKLESYFGRYNAQRTMLIITIVAIAFLCIALWLFWRAIMSTRAANEKEKQLNHEQTLFYTNARHQLRTPLALISGPIEELSESKNLKQKDSELVGILKRNVGQLSRIVTDVLEFRNDTPPDVDDNNVATKAEKESSLASEQSGRADMLRSGNDDGLATVLIVDDNADMRRYLRTLLTDKYYVIEAADGHSGLQLAFDTVPDIIISDVMMPVMDGLEFCRRIKAEPMTSHIPVILLTARSTDDQQIEGLDSGADAYMTKPFRSSLLLARTANLLKSRRQLRHLFEGTAAETKEETEKLTTPDKAFIDNLREVINKHIGESGLKMDDIGGEMGMSRVQLYRKVKALTGLTPVDLLRQMRLQRAHTLLEHSDESVAEVAYEVGFNTPGYFSTCFKKQFGVYPTDVRHKKQ